MHTDLCGPMRTASLGDAYYFTTFIDKKSKWCVVKLLKKKTNVFEALKEYKSIVENQKDRKIKIV